MPKSTTTSYSRRHRANHEIPYRVRTRLDHCHRHYTARPQPNCHWYDSWSAYLELMFDIDDGFDVWTDDNDDDLDVDIWEYNEYQLVCQFLATRHFNGRKPRSFEDYLAYYDRYSGIRNLIRYGYCKYCGGMHRNGFCFEQKSSRAA